MSSPYNKDLYICSSMGLDKFVPEDLFADLMTDSSLSSSESAQSFSFVSSPVTPEPIAGPARTPTHKILKHSDWPHSPSTPLYDGCNEPLSTSLNSNCDHRSVSLHRNPSFAANTWPDRNLGTGPSYLAESEPQCFYSPQTYMQCMTPSLLEAPNKAMPGLASPVMYRQCLDRKSESRAGNTECTLIKHEPPGSTLSAGYGLLPSPLPYWQGGAIAGDIKDLPGLRKLTTGEPGVAYARETASFGFGIGEYQSPSPSQYPYIRATDEMPISGLSVVAQQADEASAGLVGPKRTRRQRKARASTLDMQFSSKGTHKCQFVDEAGKRCNATFQRQEHFQRHSRTHMSACPFRCQLSEFVGEHNCDRRMKRSDNRDQHHFTHGKGGFNENVSSGRNVHVEPEVLIQALKKTSFCDDDECNANGPCTNAKHLAQVEKKRPSRIRSQMKRLTKGCLEPEHKRRVTKRIANMHLDHEQMKRLGFPECLMELEELQLSVEASPGARNYFRYAQKWWIDEYGDLQSWRFDDNGCLFVRDLEDDGSEHERCICGPLHKPESHLESNPAVCQPAVVKSRL